MIKKKSAELNIVRHIQNTEATIMNNSPESTKMKYPLYHFDFNDPTD